jgi:hypothetical protein
MKTKFDKKKDNKHNGVKVGKDVKTLKTRFNSSYHFLEGVGEFCKEKLGYKYPSTWGGFNVCMTPIPSLGRKQRYLFVSRVFLTPEMMHSGKIIVGTKPSPVTQAPHMRSQDYTQNFMWGNWGQGTEMSVMFIGSYDSKNGLIIDKTYTPFIISGCKSFFQKPPCVYKEAKELGIPSMLVHYMSQLTCSDFRVLTLDNDILMHDAYTTYLNKVLINHNSKTMRYERFVSSMCQLPTWLTGKDVEARSLIKQSGGSGRQQRKTTIETFKNELKDGSPYYKYFDKNWSFIGMQGEQMMFLDWFYEDGVHAVSLDPKTGYCVRNRIVEYKKDPIPRDATEVYPDFSLGTTTMSLSKTSKIDCIGVGHVKFHWDYVGFTGSRLYKQVAKIDAIFNKQFGRNYKRHIKYVYACFFYRIKQSSKSKFEMTISNLWIPYFPNEKNKYHSLVVFPMGVSKSLNDDKEIFVSAGVSDYYNVVLNFKKQEVLNSLVHDVSQMNMKKLSLDMIKY